MVKEAVTVTPYTGNEGYKYASALLHVRMETGSNEKVVLPYMGYILKIFMYSKGMGRLCKFGKYRKQKEDALHTHDRCTQMSELVIFSTKVVRIF